MIIEITDQERTALAILLELQKKFSREKGTTYTAYELWKLISELRTKISNKEITITKYHSDEDWNFIRTQIEKNTNKRYPWDEILGESLTKTILKIRKEGKNSDECYKKLLEDQRIKEYIQKNNKEKNKIRKNLKISVKARYIEQKTAKKIREEEKND